MGNKHGQGGNIDTTILRTNVDTTDNCYMLVNGSDASTPYLMELNNIFQTSN